MVHAGMIMGGTTRRQFLRSSGAVAAACALAVPFGTIAGVADTTTKSIPESVAGGSCSVFREVRWQGGMLRTCAWRLGARARLSVVDDGLGAGAVIRLEGNGGDTETFTLARFSAGHPQDRIRRMFGPAVLDELLAELDVLRRFRP